VAEISQSVVLLGYGLDSQESRFYFRQKQDFLLRPTTSEPILGPTQPAIRWEPENILWDQSCQGVNLTTHSHLVLRLRIREASYPLAHASSWRGA
jgi:hypothetical protein